MSGLTPVDGRTFFIRPDQTQTNFIRNQNSGMINTPDAGKRVPDESAQALIAKNHQAATRNTAYADGVAAAADRERDTVSRLAQYARHMIEKRTGSLIDTQA